MKAKKRVKSELKYLNDKLGQCKDMIRGVLLLKNKVIKKKITETEQRKSKTRENQRERKNSKLLHQLLTVSRLKFRCY